MCHTVLSMMGNASIWAGLKTFFFSMENHTFGIRRPNSQEQSITLQPHQCLISSMVYECVKALPC